MQMTVASAAPRAAIIGAGFMGAVHARAIHRAGGTVAVVGSSTIQRAVEAMPALRAERAASAAEAATADDVDVVHICTPNSTHLELAESAFGAGKHVVCEKPLATDLRSAQRMAAAVPAGRIAAVPFVYRFYGNVREAQGRVRAGELGALHLLHGHYLQDWLSRPTDDNWRVDPGTGGTSRAFADIGVHWCDLVEFVSGHRITRLAATTRSMSGRPTEDAAVVLFETDRGAAGSAVVSQVSPGRKNRLWFELDGADASLSFDQELPEVLWVGGRDETRIVMRGSEASAYSARFNSVPAGHPQGYQDCFDAFVSDTYSAIRGGLPDGLPSFADGLRAAVLTDTMLVAAAARTWMEVPHAV
jgi:predicted dehydrogenase